MIYLLVHKDLDGAACAVLAHYAWHPSTFHVLPVDYSNVDETLLMHWHKMHRDGRGDAVWCVDISPSQKVFDAILSGQLQNLAASLTIIDHHKHGPLADPQNRMAVPRGIYDEDACGCKLMIKALRLQTPPEVEIKLRKFIEIVDAWDRWLLDSKLRPQSEDLQRIYEFYGFTTFVSSRVGHADTVDELSEFEQKLCVHLDANEARYAKFRAGKTVVAVDEQERTFGWTVANAQGSAVAKRMFDHHKKVQYAAIIDLEHNKVELRSRPYSKVDVGVIAKARGGGGHADAAGYTLSNQDMLLLQKFTPGEGAIDDDSRWNARIKQLERRLDEVRAVVDGHRDPH